MKPITHKTHPCIQRPEEDVLCYVSPTMFHPQLTPTTGLWLCNEPSDPIGIQRHVTPTYALDWKTSRETRLLHLRNQHLLNTRPNAIPKANRYCIRPPIEKHSHFQETLSYATGAKSESSLPTKYHYACASTLHVLPYKSKAVGIWTIW